jgi:GT2 family glycosyltransferase
MTVRVTVAIVTRNRPDALRACLASLQCLSHLEPEVLVFDDASTIPVAEQIAGLEVDRLRVIRSDRSIGPTGGRNRLTEEARGGAVLLLDDDTELVDASAIESGLAILDGDRRVAAIAYGQVDRHGTPWPSSMQPGPFRVEGASPAIVPAFIGYAYLARRDVFVAVGGYRELFSICGEEKELCLRLLDAGFLTVFLPNAFVIHNPHPEGRSRVRFLRYVTRNDCLSALYNEPLRRVLWLIPARLLLYFRMRHAWGLSDPFGWAWVVRELAANIGPALRERRPVSDDTARKWAALKRQPITYEGGARL